jgi:hypothetical protein
MSEEEKIDKKNQYLALVKSYIYKFFPIVAIGVFVLVSFICYQFVLKPKYDSINDDIKESIDARVENKELLERYLLRLAKYNENYESVPKLSKDKVESFFNYGYEPEILFSQFEAIAKNQGIILSDISVQPVSSTKNPRQKSPDKTMPGGITAIKINANFIGLDYKSLKNFLSYIENTLPLININNLKFTEDKGVTIEAETYYMSQ